MNAKNTSSSKRPLPANDLDDPARLGVLSLPYLENLRSDGGSPRTTLAPPGYFQARSDGQRSSGPAPPLSLDRSATKSDRSTSAVARPSSDVAVRMAGLVDAYRTWGHRAARLDPLGRDREQPKELMLQTHGLSEDDLAARCILPGDSLDGLSLKQVIARLQRVYCGTVGVQFTQVDDLAQRRWLRQHWEAAAQDEALDRSTRIRIFNRLTAATAFEHFARKKFVGAKTFSLAGAESLIPLLDQAIERAADAGIAEIVLGMAHRGRLNVQANIFGKPPREIFRELSGDDTFDQRGRGDVRYHLGYSNDWLSQRGDRLHLSMCFNPSHLEFVNPVALGRLRAKQQRFGDRQRRYSMGILIHGDASLAGEGIVQETLNLSRLDGYETGGTLHIVVNNQLGFTTPPDEGRSSYHATDVALGYSIPVFHVNGDDVEAVVRVAGLAMEYRQKFGRDVMIDLLCFRRWGHNEMDEPSFTQPEMYERIEKHPWVREIYLKSLAAAEVLSQQEAQRLNEEHHARLDREYLAAGNTRAVPRTQTLGGVWVGHRGGTEPVDDEPATGVETERLKELLRKLSDAPDGFRVQRKLQKGIRRRQKMIDEEAPLDWSTCETLALASLVAEDRPIRLSGQDSVRGTFSQRHAVWHDVRDGRRYCPLRQVGGNPEAVEIINSPLCEAGTLGFEYGFSLDYPEALVAWEAQYGDFWNAAQVIFDQFVASAEDKWSRLSGLVMLLPHGFEGQGPEHSSARLERLLLSAAEDNYQIVAPSTPAQYFHVLRRQVLRRWRKPLIVLTPKSLLRHHAVVSQWKELAEGRFVHVLPATDQKTGSVRQVVLCWGKMYYDLLRARDERGRDDVALIRLEQFYPFPAQSLQQALQPFCDDIPLIWAQEEPENMGAWRYVQSVWRRHFPERPWPKVVARDESASPATGSQRAHKREQVELIARVFDDRR